MYFPLVICAISAIITTVSCQSSTDQYCYNKARNELDKVLNDYKIPSNFSIPDEFKEYKNLINRIKEIISKIKKSPELVERLTDLDRKINATKNEIDLISSGEKLLEEIANLANKQRNENKETQEECSKAKEKYEILRKDFEELEKQNGKINETLGNITFDIDKINEKSMKIKQSIDAVKIPSYLSEKYLCEKDIFKSFRDIITMSNKIKNILLEIREKILSDLKEIKEKLKTTPVEKLPDLSLTKEELRKDTIYFKKILNQALRLKELIDIKNQAKLDLEDIKKIVFELCRNGVCNIRQSVDVEL